MPELATRALDLDVQRLAALDPRDDSERWLRALADSGLPSKLEGEPGSPQALISALYAGAWEMSELEPVIRRGKVRLTLTFVGPPWTLGIPVGIWVLALLISFTQDGTEQRLLTFARVWTWAFFGALCLLGWMAWANMNARRLQREDAEAAKARRDEVVAELVRAREALLALPFVARLPRVVLVNNPALVELREALRRAPPSEHPPLLARREALRAQVDALVGELSEHAARGWLPIPSAE